MKSLKKDKMRFGFAVFFMTLFLIVVSELYEHSGIDLSTFADAVIWSVIVSGVYMLATMIKR